MIYDERLTKEEIIRIEILKIIASLSSSGELSFARLIAPVSKYIETGTWSTKR